MIDEFSGGAYKVSSWVDDGGESGGRYAIFTRKDAEIICGCDLDEAMDGRWENSHIAFLLTGWQQFWSGPGRAFAHEPIVKLYRHAVLVYQRTGLDI